MQVRHFIRVLKNLHFILRGAAKISVIDVAPDIHCVALRCAASQNHKYVLLDIFITFAYFNKIKVGKQISRSKNSAFTC